MGSIRVTVSTRDATTGLVVLAVDDEPHGLDELTYMLERNQHVRRALKAGDAAEALGVVGGGDPEVVVRKRAKLPPVDAVFIDINMPGLSGVELARVLAALQPPPALVFVTGIGDEAVTAFDLGAVDYVLKPLKQDRLDRAVERVLAKRSPAASASGAVAAPEPADDEVIPVELAGTTRLVPRATVRWVEAQGDYARLHTADGSHLVRIPLAQLEERWGEAGFVRIHRSFLVALSLITELKMGASGYTVVIGDNEKELPVSRRHTRQLKDRLVRAPKNGWSAGT
ncbi:MAG TPA: LytTR family DNA-binding domain-containing protein [Pseudonocardiaceae bacterium]|nr:LytTR family DNA-binding domain-containing protein [Pseudonocardiaceae bacterium]